MINFGGKEFSLDLLINYDVLKELLQALSSMNTNVVQQFNDLNTKMEAKDKEIENLNAKLRSHDKLVSDMNKRVKDLEQVMKNVEKSSPSSIRRGKKEENKNSEASEENKNEDGEIDVQKPKFTEESDISFKEENYLGSPNEINEINDSIGTLFQKVREMESKIANLEKGSNSIQAQSQSLENKTNEKINEIDEEMIKNKGELKQLISDLEEKIKKQNDALNDMQTKVSDFNVFDMFKDCGDSNIDLARTLIINLETKVFKKIGFIEDKIKDIEEGFVKLKNGTNNELNSFNIITKQLRSDFDKLKIETSKSLENLITQESILDDKIERSNEANKDSLGLLHKKILEEIKAPEKKLNKKIYDLSNLIEEISLGENLGSAAKKHKSQKGFTAIKGGLPEVNPQEIKDLDDKIKLLTTKILDVENNFRAYKANSGIDVIKGNIRQIHEILKEKLVKDDLKELYDYNSVIKDKFNSLKELFSGLMDENSKKDQDLLNMRKFIESLTVKIKSLEDLKDEKISKARGSIIDTTKFVEKSVYFEANKIQKIQMDEMKNEIEDLKTLVNMINDQINTFATKESLSALETNITNLITDFKSLVNKKYADKIEINKTIRILETQIKQMISERGEHIESSGENWLLAKRPINCFKCASCESNIANLTKKEEYIPWNKYPAREDKSYRMGAGFSHMLKMINNELISNYEKEYVSDGEKEKLQTDKAYKIQRKVKLPKVGKSHKLMNSMSHQIIDGGEDGLNNDDRDSDDNNKFNNTYEIEIEDNNSPERKIEPKIMKISKRKRDGSNNK